MNELSFFIIGMPRSGTKLLRELLNNHNEIFIPKIETLFIPSLLRKYRDSKLSLWEVEHVIQEIKGSLFFFYYQKSNRFDFSPLKVGNIRIKEFIDLLFVQIAKQQGYTAPILGDKSPNYIEDIRLLLKNYTKAKFIHIVRDPRDHALSMRKAWGKNIYRAAYRWTNSIQHLNDNFPENMIEIKYEELIASPERVLSNVCAFLSVTFDRDMIKLDKSIENLGAAKLAGIKKDNSNKFRDELTCSELSKMESIVCEWLRKYDYPLYSTVLKKMRVNKMQLAYWKACDCLNLLKFNIREHGMMDGLEKLYKANKYS